MKFVLNLILIRIPEINVNGAAIGSVLCHLIATCIVSRVLVKNIKLNITFKSLVFKPVIAVCIMGVLAFVSYKLFASFLGEYSRIATLFGLMIAVISYALSVVKLKILSEEDYKSLPAGEKILKVLKKVKLL